MQGTTWIVNLCELVDILQIVNQVHDNHYFLTIKSDIGLLAKSYMEATDSFRSYIILIIMRNNQSKVNVVVS